MSALAYHTPAQLSACLLTRAQHSAPKPSSPREHKQRDDIERDYRREVSVVLWRFVQEGVEL